MAKIIIDATSLKVLERLAEFFDRLDAPYQMPDLMTEWLHTQHHGTDSYYSIPVGFGNDSLQLRFTFKKEIILMEFLAPDGMRLMELRLHT